MKSASEIMTNTDPKKIGLALIYIEHEREMFQAKKEGDEKERYRHEGIMSGILLTCNLLGLDNFYGTTITNLRFAIQEERKKKIKLEAEDK